MSYLTLAELSGENRWFEFFAEELYGTNGTLSTSGSARLLDDIDDTSREIDDVLRTADSRFTLLPIKKNDSGEYPQSVVNWCAHKLIHMKMMSRFQGEFDEIPDSISYHGSKAMQISDRILAGGIGFENEIMVGELGIGEPEVVGSLNGTSVGTFHSNWRGYPYPSDFTTENTFQGYLGEDFPRTFMAEIITAGGIGTAEYRWSRDVGMNWEGTVTTDYEWTHLKDNVYVRFEPNPTGTHHFTVNDKWKWDCVPKSIRKVFGKDDAHVTRSGRGF